MAESRITIAVVSHNQQQLAADLLKSLETVAPVGGFQVVLLENVPEAEVRLTGEYSFPVMILHNDEERGYSENLNRIFQAAGKSSEYFCILNPDIRFVNNVFPILLHSMEAHGVEIIAPLMRDSAGTVQDSFRDVPRPDEIVLRYAGLKAKTRDPGTLPKFIHPEWIAAMFLLMPSDVYQALGGFDEGYRLYFEDVDFSLRARQAGYTLGVEPAVYVLHDAQRSSHRNLKLLRFHILSAIRFFTSPVYRAEKKQRA